MNTRMGAELALDLAREGRADAASPEIHRLAALAEEISAMPDPGIDPAFAARLEERLLAEMPEPAPAPQPIRQVHPVPAPARPAPTIRPAEPGRAPVIPLPRRRVVLRRAFVAAAAAAMLMAFAVVASGSALPGSPLYPVKDGIERIELWLAGSPAEEAIKRLEVAERSFIDAQRAMAIGNEQAATAALEKRGAHLERAQIIVLESLHLIDHTVLGYYVGTLSSQTETLTGLIPSVSPGFRPAVVAAAAQGERVATTFAVAISAGGPADRARGGDIGDLGGVSDAPVIGGTITGGASSPAITNPGGGSSEPGTADRTGSRDNDSPSSDEWRGDQSKGWDHGSYGGEAPCLGEAYTVLKPTCDL